LLDTVRGKTAVITGGSGGFRRGIVEALVARGARVVLVARHGPRLEAPASDVDGVEVVAGDVTDGVHLLA
jgi:NAD(P)-dependent dehydrogenase (short-subunit alcohol dehydrogenase family)